MRRLYETRHIPAARRLAAWLLAAVFSLSLCVQPAWASPAASAERTVIPLGKAVGIKLFAAGVLVVGLAVLLSAIPLGFFDDKKICKEVRQELRERPRYWKWAIVIYWTVIAALVVAVNVIYPLVTPSM